ncbi:MAG: flavin-containing monooxygenase [Candidatus Kariarchaeaceae archaeon]|jgi:putative flavoprotein involved in K+ transport
MNIDKIDTIIIGGGQAGLATSYYLKGNQIEHIILEKAEKPAYAWRDQKWDSFCFVTPNWTLKLPEGKCEDFNIDPDGFVLKSEIIEYLEQYIKRHDLPIKYNAGVNSVKNTPEGWLVETDKQNYLAINVFIATGFFQTPKIPSFAVKIPDDVYQIHTSKYRNPQELKEGEILVVGSGQSGMQIAEEIYLSGKKVHLSVGSTGRIPRVYRGKDILHWWIKIGMYDKHVSTLENPKERFGSNPHVSGVNGGGYLSLHQFYKDGVSLYGHITDVSADGKIIAFTDDVHDLVKKSDDIENKVLDLIDDAIKLENIAEPAWRNQMKDAYEQKVITKLDLIEQNIKNIIWATGYDRDYSFIDVEGGVVDDMGFPIQKDGVSPHAGLYFIGMPWIRSPGSGVMYGVGADAKLMVKHLVEKTQKIKKLANG